MFQSRRGAELQGGRFNPKGAPTLCSALVPVTALREASQVGSLQPTILVSYRADIAPVLDARKAERLAANGMIHEALADPGWRLAMLEGRRVPTQAWARGLIAGVYARLLIRSFDEAATDSALGFVLSHWSSVRCSIEVVYGGGGWSVCDAKAANHRMLITRAGSALSLFARTTAVHSIHRKQCCAEILTARIETRTAES